MSYIKKRAIMKPTKKKKVYFQLYIPLELREKIKLEACLAGDSMNDFIINSLKKRIEKIDERREKKLTDTL
jgi:predicted HicB family RNase H-like nuclease